MNGLRVILTPEADLLSQSAPSWMLQQPYIRLWTLHPAEVAK